jgi:hypothetical protein
MPFQCLLDVSSDHELSLFIFEEAKTSTDKTPSSAWTEKVGSSGDHNKLFELIDQEYD